MENEDKDHSEDFKDLCIKWLKRNERTACDIEEFDAKFKMFNNVKEKAGFQETLENLMKESTNTMNKMREIQVESGQMKLSSVTLTLEKMHIA